MRITIAEFNADWSAAFETERARLADLLGSVASEIEHIGSTSVPGLAAKPVVDIQVGVTSLADFEKDDGIAKLENAGYVYLPQFETIVPFRHLFTRDVHGTRQNNLHLVAADHPWFRRHIVFRDYLRINEAARRRYETAKRELAMKEWNDVNDYAQAKTEVVIGIEEEAFDHFDLSTETRVWLRTSRID